MRLFTERHKNRMATFMFFLSTALIMLILVSTIAYVLFRGFEVLSPGFFLENPHDVWLEGGILPAIWGTFYTVILALLFATPLGVGASVYLTQYPCPGRLRRIVRVGSDSLNAIPSIVFGLLGLSLFLFYLKLRPSVLAAGLTLGFMILPTIIRTSEVAIRAVPRQDIEGSYALGATRLQTIVRVVIPSALPGIATGVILGLGRAAGETAPIIWLASFWPAVTPLLPGDSFNSLTVILYSLVSEAQTEAHITRAFGMASVLILLVLFLNYITRTLNKRLTKNIRRT